MGCVENEVCPCLWRGSGPKVAPIFDQMSPHTADFHSHAHGGTPEAPEGLHCRSPL